MSLNWFAEAAQTHLSTFSGKGPLPKTRHPFISAAQSDAAQSKKASTGFSWGTAARRMFVCRRCALKPNTFTSDIRDSDAVSRARLSYCRKAQNFCEKLWRPAFMQTARD